MQLCQPINAENIVKSENRPSINPLPQIIPDVERLNQALPGLIQPEDRNRLPNESAQIYYARLEPFRRICEAREVLRWIAGAYFSREEHTRTCRHSDHSIACYFTNVTAKRGKESASILKSDALDLFRIVIEHDPSLKDLLHSQLKLLK